MQTSVRHEERHAPRPLRSLVILNALGLAILAAVTFNPAARAQNRVPGEYTMVAGGAKGTAANVVYVVDTINQEMIAVTYDTTSNALQGVGGRNLAADAATLLRARGTNR